MTFEAEERERTTNQSIGWAVRMLRQGREVRRAGWNGKGMWLGLQPAGRVAVDRLSELVDAGVKGDVVVKTGSLTRQHWESAPYVFMKTADDKIVPWLCSQTDLLANDWELSE